ncbi:unnamed protein product [Rhizophagus irregularis]|nr:unnamed protein product [Rhizophagus irregularis]CAB4430256.1 unnamed protein product [Rhizophagus irregularis]
MLFSLLCLNFCFVFNIRSITNYHTFWYNLIVSIRPFERYVTRLKRSSTSGSGVLTTHNFYYNLRKDADREKGREKTREKGIDEGRNRRGKKE